MLREVECHSALDDDNIVIYKYTWQGSPLPDEQETIDKFKLLKLNYGESASSSTLHWSPDSENHEQDPAEEYQYIVMELCEGGTLKDKINSNSISKPAEPLQILQQICSALAYIHDKGLIHRDLKPANIFLQKEKIKVGDFGLVTERGKQQEKDSNSQEKEKDSTSQEQKTNGVGTRVYMAPEVEERNDYDSKADIFSLGIIFLELLLHVPFSTTGLLWQAMVWGGETRFNYSSFLLYLANWLKDKSANKSEWTEEARKMQQNARIMIDELMKIPW